VTPQGLEVDGSVHEAKSNAGRSFRAPGDDGEWTRRSLGLRGRDITERREISNTVATAPDGACCWIASGPVCQLAQEKKSDLNDGTIDPLPSSSAHRARVLLAIRDGAKLFDEYDNTRY
jgi:hypothetical protein